MSQASTGNPPQFAQVQIPDPAYIKGAVHFPVLAFSSFGFPLHLTIHFSPPLQAPFFDLGQTCYPCHFW